MFYMHVCDSVMNVCRYMYIHVYLHSIGSYPTFCICDSVLNVCRYIIISAQRELPYCIHVVNVY